MNVSEFPITVSLTATWLDIGSDVFDVFVPWPVAVKLENNPWIVQPFEVYEEIRIEDINKKHQK